MSEVRRNGVLHGFRRSAFSRCSAFSWKATLCQCSFSDLPARATKARQDAANLINTEKKVAAKAERTARTHELCNSAGLLILAGLVDTKTGKPAIDKGELLGALLGLAKVPVEDPRRKEWKRAGDSIISDTSTQ